MLKFIDQMLGQTKYVNCVLLQFTLIIWFETKPALYVHVSWLHYFLGYEIFTKTCSSDVDFADQYRCDFPLLP